MGAFILVDMKLLKLRICQHHNIHHSSMIAFVFQHGKPPSDLQTMIIKDLLAQSVPTNCLPNWPLALTICLTHKFLHKYVSASSVISSPCFTKKTLLAYYLHQWSVCAHCIIISIQESTQLDQSNRCKDPSRPSWNLNNWSSDNYSYRS